MFLLGVGVYPDTLPPFPGTTKAGGTHPRMLTQVMFAQVFVCQEGGEVSVQGISVQGVSLFSWRGSLFSGVGVSIQGDRGLCPGGGGSLSSGVSIEGGSLSGRPLYGKERTVRILLECTLVLFCLLFFFEDAYGE